jgi:hypothetical protein
VGCVFWWAGDRVGGREREGKGWPEKKGTLRRQAGELGGRASSESWSSLLVRAERDRSGKRIFRLEVGTSGTRGSVNEVMVR